MGWFTDLLNDIEMSRRAARKEMHIRSWWEHFGKYLPKEVLFKSKEEFLQYQKRWN